MKPQQVERNNIFETATTFWFRFVSICVTFFWVSGSVFGWMSAWMSLWSPKEAGGGAAKNSTSKWSSWNHNPPQPTKNGSRLLSNRFCYKLCDLCVGGKLAKLDWIQHENTKRTQNWYIWSKVVQDWNNPWVIFCIASYLIRFIKDMWYVSDQQIK